ncbi:uncharacterized protein LOC113230420 isoform X2 [Hyposmocoma kahamanoa]|uniref:uncharacterized protein LOC113230420 isoform X2 n=1 Tax=Hyposmocoma kahamanoa TaxID=1477025 RepID=UPI000E6D60BD|nr:uncharacterized protein LOC113230420 isoform X2 [Hyposmocoma kahamanoa]
MQTSTLVVLACLIATVAAYTHYEKYPALEAVNIPNDAAYESIYDTPAHERSPRMKRGLLLLKKKLLLGALGLKAAKVGAAGAGVAAALALKKKPQSVHTVHIQPAKHYGHGPSWNVEVHRWH